MIIMFIYPPNNDIITSISMLQNSKSMKLISCIKYTVREDITPCSIRGHCSSALVHVLCYVQYLCFVGGRDINRV
jgi:hypothetical protein